jgi:hypothetical protein
MSNFLEQITTELRKNNVEPFYTMDETGVTVTMRDEFTKTTVGVAKGNTLEEAVATILGRFAGSTRNVKVYDTRTSYNEL